MHVTHIYTTYKKVRIWVSAESFLKSTDFEYLEFPTGPKTILTFTTFALVIISKQYFEAFPILDSWALFAHSGIFERDIILHNKSLLSCDSFSIQTNCSRVFSAIAENAAQWK